jgi:hypothetical protein
MDIIQDIARLNDVHPSQNSDAFIIHSSPVEGAGMACFASRDLQPSEVVLHVEKPIANVVINSFRKEVCSWCYSYNYGAIHKLKLATDKGRGIVWFCQQSCRDEWRLSLGDVGWEATVAFEDGLTRTKLGGELARQDGPCDIEQFENLWDQASQEGHQIMLARRTKPRHQPKTAKLPAHVDVDVARFILSALISFQKEPATLQEVLRLTPTLSPYLSSRNTLLDHRSIYHYLLSVLPINCPIISLVTPSNIVATVSRDAGNSWGIWDLSFAGQELFAYCMYPSASYFNHSCEPNTTKERVGRVYQFKAKGNIPKGSELNVSYLGGAEDTLNVIQRRKRLLVSHPFNLVPLLTGQLGWLVF